jgi:copper chaperone CopZ
MTTGAAGTTSQAVPAALLKDADRPLGGSSATLTVHGLACPLCAKGVDKELRTLPGVQPVDMDVINGLVRITFDPANPPTRLAVIDAVRFGGAVLIDLRQP